MVHEPGPRHISDDEWSRIIATAVGHNIQAFRTGRGWSRELLAAKIGVRWNAVKGWEAGENPPRLEALLKIVEALKLASIEELLGGPLGTTQLLDARLSAGVDASRAS